MTVAAAVANHHDNQIVSMSDERTQLKRTLTPFSLFSLAFGTIIGVGWITVLGAWLVDAGSIGAMIAFAAGGLVMIPVALCYTEVAGMYPVSGGEVAYIYEMYGARMSFLAGWLLAFVYIATVSFEAISVGWVLSAMFPGSEGPTVYVFLDAEVKAWSLAIGLAIMALLTAINYWGAKSTAWFQNLFVSILLFASAVFVVSGLVNSDTANLEPAFAGDSAGSAAFGVLAVLATTPFWFGGFDTVPQAMGEVSTDSDLRALPRVMIMAVTIATLFYMLIILTAALTVDRTTLLSYDLPLAGAVQAASGSFIVRQLVLFAGLCGLITTWNALMFAATRVIFSLGRARMLPQGFARVHPRFGSPSSAALFVGFVAALGSLMGREAILVIAGAGALVFATLIVLVIGGAIRLRLRNPDYPRPYTFPGGLAGLGAALALAVVIFLLAAIGPLLSSGGSIPHEWLLLGGWVVLGLLFYALAGPLRSRVSKQEQRWLILGDAEPQDTET